jgi:hypothetical protein
MVYRTQNRILSLMSTPTQRLSPEAADDRAEILFFEALKQSTEVRSGFLDEACGADAKLRAEVETLLRDHERAGGFLTRVSHFEGFGSRKCLIFRPA